MLKQAATIVLGAALCAVAASSARAADNGVPAEVGAQWDLLDGYCVECHNYIDWAGGVAFDVLAAEDIDQDAETWERVVRKLRGHLMPPPGSEKPEEGRIEAFVAAMETHLDGLITARGPQPGHVPVHRLNRTEYARAVRSMLGIEIDPRALLPADNVSHGFDNVAGVLRVSPTYLDQYIAAARTVSMRAVGNPEAPLQRDVHLADRANQAVHVPGLPFGTRGGLHVTHHFPADGEYEFSINVNTEGGAELRAYPHGWLEYEHTVILTVDGERVFESSLGGDADLRALDQQQATALTAIQDRFRGIRIDVPAGDRDIGVAFIARSYAESDKLLQPTMPGTGVRSVPLIRELEVIGPYEPRGISQPTASRERIFICRPETEAEELPCADRILGNLAQQAFRRPVTDDDVRTLRRFFRNGNEQGGFETGIQQGLMAILASPKFLYRAAAEDAGQAASENGVRPISDLELASRLSFFLWSQGPDEQLLELAHRGELRDPDTYEAQIRRMLADPRSQSLVTNFGFQWLGVRGIDSVDPDARLYPNFDEDLRDAFRTEMALFLDSILREDRSIVELLTASHTFVNERLARHYGIPGVRGDRFRRVELADSRRWGLFGKGSVLLVTSYAHRTSPVLRGEWILEYILATPPAPVPPDVETDLTAAVTQDGQPLSLRDRLEIHRSEPSCNQCHGVIDPLGQALENFNVIGEWRERERDTGAHIDASGYLADGRPVDGPDALREALAANPRHFAQALTEKLMVFALGRGLEYTDMPTVRRIVGEAAEDDYRFSSIVLGVATSDAFRKRRAPTPDDGLVARESD